MARLIRDYDWAKAEMGPFESWPRSLKTAVDLMLANPMVSTLAVGPDLKFLFNDRAAPLYGARAESALGRPLVESFPEAGETVRPFYERALAGESVTVRAMPLDTRFEGTQTELFDAYLTPVRDEAGEVSAVLMNAFAAASESAETKDALRRSEAKYRSLFESIDEGLAIVEMIYDGEGEIADMIFRQVNAAYERQGGVYDVVGRSIHDVLPGVEEIWLDRYKRVAKTGESIWVEDYQQDVDRWFDVRFTRLDDRGRFVAIVFNDVTIRKQAEQTLRQSEERQAFLLRFSDCLRAEGDADAVANRAIRMLSSELQLDRCYITFYRLADDAADFPYQVGNGSVPPLPQTIRLSDFPDAFEQVRKRTFVVDDDFERQGLTDAEKANARALGMRAMVASTARTEGKGPLCSLAAVSSRPRKWTSGEINLVEEAAERTWAAIERARAETALRESEVRFRMLFETMDEGFVVNELVRDETGKAVDLRYLELNPAVERLVGWNAKETVGRLMSEMLTPEETEQWVNYFANVVASGNSLQSEHNHESLGMWFRANATPIGGDRVALVYQNITNQKRAEMVLRESEERQAFLLKLSDAVRPLADPADIQGETTRLLREQLNVGWCYYVDWDLDRKMGLVLRDSAREGLPSLAGAHDVSDASEFLQILAGGAVLSVRDYAGYEQLSSRIRRQFADLGFRSMMVAPLIREGRLLACLLVGDTEVRDWSPSEASLIFEVGERTWAAIERGRAEAALRQSEEKYRTLFETIDEGFCVIELVHKNGRSVDYRLIEVNPAFEHQSGLSKVSGKLRTEVAPLGDEEQWLKTYDEVARTGKAQRFERYHEPTNRWYSVYVAAAAEHVSSPRLTVVFTDITLRKQAETALRDSEEKYRNLYNRMGQGYIEVELIRGPDGDAVDYRYVVLNPAYERLTGIPVDKAVGRPSLEVIPDLSPFWAETFQRIVDNQTAEEFEYEEKALDRWFGIYAYPAGGDRLTVLALDITQRKKAEASLRESEERLRQFGDASQDVLWIRDAESLQWHYLTPAFEAIYGLTREEALSGDNYRSWLELIVPEDRATANQNISRVRNGEHVVFEYRVRRPRDGEIRWLRNTDFPIKDATGKVTLIGGIGVDFTDEKAAQERIERSEERLRSAVEVGKLGLWDWNVLTGEVHWSDEHFRMEGYAVGEVTPTYEAWASRIHPDDRTKTEEALHRAMTDHDEYVSEFRVVHPDGSVHWLHGRGRFFYDGASNPVRMIGAMIDTTERRELEEQQKVLVAELQHRTRNLMGVVRSMSDKTARASADLSDFRSRFRDRLDALSRVQGLLSRLNEHDRVTFDDLIQNELAAMGGASERVTLNGPRGVRLRSSTVQTLAMALHELATNAVKYGALGQPNGHLTVSWSLEPSEEGHSPWLHVHWQEQGVDMASAKTGVGGGGQGRELIEHALPYQLNAKTTYALGRDGVNCTIAIPISAHPAKEDEHV